MVDLRSPQMRVLFVSGTSVGGAARSTVELARALHERGHATAVVLADDADARTHARHKSLLNLRVKLEQRRAPALVVAATERAHRAIGRRLDQHGPTSGPTSGPPVWRAAQPENALAHLRTTFRPDAVVVNSVERPAWRQMRAELEAAGIPSVLYMREATAVRHLADPPAPPTLLLANAQAHADAAQALGFECPVVPSVVDVSNSAVESTRERVLMVNPVALYDVDRALALAAALPDVPFAFAESWPLSDDERAHLDRALQDRPNVELRAPTDAPSEVYRDARILLMLCTVPSRPRVIAEAQANGIPVLAVDRPGHGEGVGPGGILVAPDAPFEQWVATLARMWHDAAEYERLATAARAHAARADFTPDAVTAKFEALLASTLGVASAR